MMKKNSVYKILSTLLFSFALSSAAAHAAESCPQIGSKVTLSGGTGKVFNKVECTATAEGWKTVSTKDQDSVGAEPGSFKVIPNLRHGQWSTSTNPDRSLTVSCSEESGTRCEFETKHIIKNSQSHLRTPFSVANADSYCEGLQNAIRQTKEQLKLYPSDQTLDQRMSKLIAEAMRMGCPIPL